MKCKLKKIIYESKDNGFIVCVLTTPDTLNIPESIRINNGLAEFSATGYNIPNSESTLDIDGKWIDTKYGLQLQIESCIESLPTNKDGIIAYLSSDIFTGIGAKTAEIIYNELGDNAIEKIQQDPKCIVGIAGVTEKKAHLYAEKMAESNGIRNLVMFLNKFNISMTRCQSIYKAYGAKSLEILKTNPYNICKVRGFGFLTADDIARKINVSLTSIDRIQACILFILSEISKSGHLFINPNDLAQLSYKYLNNGEDEIISLKTIEKQIKELKRENEVVIEGKSRVYLWQTFKEESESAKKIVRINRQKNVIENIDKKISVIEKDLNIKLDASQKQAIVNCYNFNLSIVTGGPGTGKTTILKVVTKLANDENLLLMAPTGRAARRMSESCGIEASTIHSALGLFGDGNEVPEILNSDFIIIDESSMIDQKLMYLIMESIDISTRILLVGDVDQLPSVGAGNVLRELIKSNLIPTTYLRTIYRQSEESYISLNARLINSGNVKLNYGSDFKFIECNSNTEVLNTIKQTYVDLIKEYSIESVQVLTPSRNKGSVCTDTINEILRREVNPFSEDSPQLKFGNKVFRLGDKVMQTRNKKVSNGEIGFIIEISDSELVVEYSDNRLIDYAKEDLEFLQHAYSTTIHKSQGSEYDVVIIPLLKSNFIMLKRNLLYTAITRGKQKVIIVGDKWAISKAITTNDIGDRNTNLSERIIFENEKISRKYSSYYNNNKQKNSNVQISLH
mgnify:CR=1 FL=1